MACAWHVHGAAWPRGSAPARSAPLPPPSSSPSSSSASGTHISLKSSEIKPSHASSQSAPRALAYSTSDGASPSHVSGSSCDGPPGQGPGQALGRRLASGQRATWPRFGLGRVPWRGPGSGRGGSLVSLLGRRLPTLPERHEDGGVHLLLGKRGDQREPAVACVVRGLARAGLALSALAVKGLRHLLDRTCEPLVLRRPHRPTRRETPVSMR